MTAIWDPLDKPRHSYRSTPPGPGGWESHIASPEPSLQMSTQQSPTFSNTCAKSLFSANLLTTSGHLNQKADCCSKYLLIPTMYRALFWMLKVKQKSSISENSHLNVENFNKHLNKRC